MALERIACVKLSQASAMGHVLLAFLRVSIRFQFAGTAMLTSLFRRQVVFKNPAVVLKMYAIIIVVVETSCVSLCTVGSTRFLIFSFHLFTSCVKF